MGLLRVSQEYHQVRVSLRLYSWTLTFLNAGSVRATIRYAKRAARMEFMRNRDGSGRNVSSSGDGPGGQRVLKA